MKKKLLLGLLVVLMVGILAFSVFACQPKDDGKDKGDKDKPDDTTKPVETTLDVKAGPMFNDIIASVNNTAKVAANIEDAASVNVDLYVNVEIGDTKVDVKLNVAGSVDAGTNANNWAIVSADVKGVQVSLFAEKNSNGTEYLYIGQNILNKEVVWSKLSQAENANLLSGTPAEKFTDANANKAYDEGEEYVDANENGAYDGEKFGVVPELFELIASIDENTEAKLNAGILNDIGIIGTIKGAVGMVGGLLFAPIDGVTNIEEIDENTFETDLSSANGYAAKLNIKDLSAVIGGLGGVLEGLLKDDQGNKINLAPYQGIVDMVVPIILGGQFNLSDFTFTPGTAVPEIQLLVDINSDKTFGGLHLSYEHDVDLDTTDSEPAKHVKVAFGLDNISFKATSATKPAAIVSAVADAEELAINLGLDIELDKLVGGYANLDLNVYPNVSVGFDKDGYLALDLSKLYAEVVLSYNESVGWDYDENKEILEPATKVIAQYNADGGEDIIFDFATVASVFGYYSEDTFKIPVNLSEKYADFIAEQKAGKAVVVENAGLVDDVIGLVSGIINKPEGEKLDIVGLVMDIAGYIKPVVEEVTALKEYVTVVEGTATVDVEGLIADLIADDGLIGESEKAVFGLYNEEGVKEDVALADIMAKGAVLDNIAALVNALMYEGAVAEADRETTTYAMWKETAELVTTDDIIGLVADFTGATLNKNDAYANMAISATGYAQGNGANGEGVGAIVSAVLGADGTTAEIKLGLNASIIANKEVYEDTLGAATFEAVTHTVIKDNKFVTISTNTGDDGAMYLVDELKNLFNFIVTDEQFELNTLEPFVGTVVTEADAEELGYVQAYNWCTYGFVETGYGIRFMVEADEGATVYVYNINGTEAVAQWLVNSQFGPMPQMADPVIMAENNDQASFVVGAGETGIMFTVYGVTNAITRFNIMVEDAPQEGEGEVAVPAGAIELVIGENTTGAFAYGLGGTNTYFYTYTATEDCTLSFTYSEGHFVGSAENGMMGWVAFMPFNNDQIELVAGQTIVIAVENQIYDDVTGDRDASAVTFTASVAVNG